MTSEPPRWKLAIPFSSQEPIGILKVIAEGIVDGDTREIHIDFISEASQ